MAKLNSIQKAVLKTAKSKVEQKELRKLKKLFKQENELKQLKDSKKIIMKFFKKSKH